MSIESELKEKLSVIKTNNYEVSKEEVNILVPQMLEHIGSLDSEIRDKLIYSNFFMWIMNGKFTHDELRQLLKTSMSETYLFYKIDKVDSVSVYKRSFSVLIVAVILNYNRNINFLSELEVLETYHKLVDYFKKEKDYRGFDREHGWAHSIAHAADALDEIVKYSVINEEKLKYVLFCIKEKIQIDHYVYTNGEDERLVIAIYSLFKRNVVNTLDIEKWIDDIISYQKKKIYPEDHNIIMNIKCLLRSLYFRIVNDESFNDIALYIKHKLDLIDEYQMYQ